MFAKLAQQHAKATPEDPVHEPAPETEDSPPSPALPEVVQRRLPAHKTKGVMVSGKRGHPDYCQANAYVPKSVRKEVDKALLDIDGLDYSSLVTDLLRKWLKARGVSA